MVKRSGTIRIRPSVTALAAASAMGPTLTNHCLPAIGSTTVLQRWQCPTEWVSGSALSRRPSASRSWRIRARHSATVKPVYWGPAASVIEDRGPMTVMRGRLWRWAISKSLGSWAGVTLTAPVPNSVSTAVSATTGMGRFRRGRITFWPTKSAKRSSSGLTATAVSPRRVSGRVVATVR